MSALSNIQLSAPPPPPITQVWLMDGWRIMQHGKLCDVPLGQPRALLTYLLLQPGHSALRSTLVEELWPDVGTERGRRYLSDALYRLRRALDPAPFLADAERIALDMEHDWWVDVWAFYAAATSANQEEQAASLDLYANQLAPEITEHWILIQRLRLQERFIQTALEIATHAEQNADPQRAETLYRRTLEVDPLLESAHRGIMRALARHGQLAAALEHYDHLVNRLEQELSVPPSVETRQLAEQLFQELDLARRRAETRTIRRLVGRVDERSRLLTALDSARAGHASIIVLLGEAGIGKSALLRDLAHAADWRGWQIHWGTSQVGQSPAPYAPLTLALQEALPAPRAAQLATTLPSIYYDLLARLFPELHHPHTLPIDAFEPRRLPQALVQLLHALQEIAPLLLLLDNVQWGDSALWALLNEMAPLLYQQRTLIVISAQTEALQADPTIWAQLESWDRQGIAQVIALTGLQPNTLGELASIHTATHPTPQDSLSTSLSVSQIQALHTASGGNPLLALEILAAGTPYALLESRPAIATLVAQRLSRLSAQARQAIGIAAILGTQLNYDQWLSLWQSENPYTGDLATQATELERAEIIQINRQGYSFAHDTLHAAALADMDAKTRNRRHALALNLLEQATTPPILEPLRLLYHAQGSNNTQAIVRYALLAGEQALRAFAFAHAETHFTLALAHLAESHAPEIIVQRYHALIGRVQARHVMAQREGQHADLDALQTLAQTAALSPAQQIMLLSQRAEYHLAISEMAEVQSIAHEALSMGDLLIAPQRAALHLLLARSARDSSQLETAQAQLMTARAIYQHSGDEWGVAMTTDMLGGLAWDQGDYERSAQLHKQAADAFQRISDQIHEAQSLNNLGSAYWELGRYADARATHERSILVCRELGNKLGESDNIDNLGGVAWALGDYTLALRQYRAALQLRESINDLWGVAISLSNLASTHRLLGAHEQALDNYQRSLPLYDQVGRKRGRAYVIEGQGQTLLAMGRLDEAWERLQEALALRTEIGDRTHLVEIYATMIHAAIARNDLPIATEYSAQIVTLLTHEDRASLRQQAHYAQYRLATCLGNEDEAARALAHALTARDEMAAMLPEADRTRFLQNVPLNRDLAHAEQTFTRQESLVLGMGKQAKAIHCTLCHPQDYLIHDESERRRHRLTRIIAQAAAQQIMPTHDQLAAAFGVSRRTILRDMALQQGSPEEITENSTDAADNDIAAA